MEKQGGLIIIFVEYNRLPFTVYGLRFDSRLGKYELRNSKQKTENSKQRTEKL